MAKRDSNLDPLNSNLNSDTPPGNSKAQQLKDQVKDQARSLADQAKDSTSELAGEARDRVQGLVSEQKGRVADQLGSLAGALREAGGKLDEQHTNGLSLGRYASQAADRVRADCPTLNKVYDLSLAVMLFDRPGDPAPDFSLLKLDKSERIQLSQLTAKQPVVLVFGSYT